MPTMLAILRRKLRAEAPDTPRFTLPLPVGTEEPDPNSPHLYGQYDGGLAIDNDAFAEFLQAATRREHLSERIATLQKQREQLQEQLQRAEAAQISAQTLPERLQALERALPEARQRLEQVRRQREQCEQELQALRRSPEVPSLVQVLMYGAAGVAFLVGDIIVSKEIVAQVLYLPLEYERWLFALGLACITFVLKVAYDRLVELPFWQHIRRRFEVVILSISALALITLVFMGALRTQEIQRQHLLRSTEQTVWSLEAESPSVQQQIPTPDNTVLLVTFILSAVMFATAGAVCFSTAHTHARGYFHVYRPLREAYDALTVQEQNATRRLETLEESLTADREELARANATLALVGTPEMLRQDLKQIDEHIAGLQEQLADLLSEQRRASYRSGRERALQYRRLLTEKPAEDEVAEAPEESPAEDETGESMAASGEISSDADQEAIPLGSEENGTTLPETAHPMAIDGAPDGTADLPEGITDPDEAGAGHSAEPDEAGAESTAVVIGNIETATASTTEGADATEGASATEAASTFEGGDNESDGLAGTPDALSLEAGDAVVGDESAAAGGDSSVRAATPRSRRERGVRHGLRRPFLDIRDEILDLTA